MKYGVTITYIERAYKEVEAENGEEAIEIVAGMGTGEWEPLGEDDFAYEAEVIENA